MTDDTHPERNCEIELIYAVKERMKDAGPRPSIFIGDRLARIQGLIEQAIAQEFGEDPVLVSADVRFRRFGSSAKPRRPRESPSSSKKDIILKLLESKDGVTTKGLQEATGWKPSTVSAQLDYLSKTGHSISRLKEDGALRYRLA